MLLLALLLATQDDPARLSELLRSDRLEEREDAARRLKQLEKAAVPALTRLSADPDTETAGRARQILAAIDLRGRLGPALLAAMPGLDDRLAGADDRQWTLALRDAVARLRPKGPLRAADLEALAGPALRGADPEDATLDVPGLILNYGWRSAVPQLLEHVSGREVEWQRRDALAAILLLDREGTLRHLEKLLADPRSAVRARAALMLGDSEADETADRLVPLLRDPEDRVIEAALRALLALRARQAGEAIRPLLRSRNSERRALAAEALGRLRCRAAAEDVAALLRDGEPDPRIASAAALPRLLGARAEPLLVPLLRDPQDGVRAAAAQALLSLDAREAAPELLRLLEDSSSRPRDAAIEALRWLRCREAIPAVLKLAEHPVASTRARAQEFLVDLEAREALPVFARLAADPVPAVAISAVDHLVRTGGSAALPHLLALLPGASSDVRCQILGRLPELAGPDLLPRILALAVDPDGKVATEAIWAATHLDPWQARSGLRNLLDSPRDAIAAQAATALAWLGEPGLLPQLRERARRPGSLYYPALRRLLGEAPLEEVQSLLDDPSAELRLAAGEALRNRGQGGLLLGWIGHPDPERRWIALRAAYEVEPKRLDTHALRKVLKSGERSHRVAAAVLLRRAHASEAVPELRDLLKDPDLEVRKAGLEALGGLRDPGSRRAILALLDDRECLSTALRALGSLGDRESLTAVADFLEDPEGEVRIAAALASFRLGDPRGRQVLKTGMTLPSDRQRNRAVEAAEELGDPELLLEAARRLADPEDLMKGAATIVLEPLKALCKPSALRPFLSDSDSKVRRAGLVILGEWHDPEAPELAASSLSDPHPDVRAEAARTLASLEAVGAADRVRALLADPHERVRAAAAEALGTLGVKVDVLLHCLDDEDESVREAALRGLGRLGDRSAFAAIVRMASAREAGVRGNAARALGELGMAEAVPTLKAFLADRDARLVAIQALARIGKAADAPELLPLQGSGDDSVRRAATKALAELGHPRGIPPFFQAGNWNHLNGIRRPDVWMRLRSIRIRTGLQGPWKELLARIAREVGLPLEFTPAAAPEWAEAVRRVPRLPGGVTALELFLDLVGGDRVFILEPDRIRILPVKDAHAFWRVWLEEQATRK
jgi:HEAT repeat protein